MKVIGELGGVVRCSSIRASISATTLTKASGMFITILSYTTAATVIAVGPVVTFCSGGPVTFPRDYINHDVERNNNDKLRKFIKGHWGFSLP